MVVRTASIAASERSPRNTLEARSKRAYKIRCICTGVKLRIGRGVQAQTLYSNPATDTRFLFAVLTGMLFVLSFIIVL